MCAAPQPSASTNSSRPIALPEQSAWSKPLSAFFLPFEKRELVVLRHGETIGDLYPDWISRSQLSNHSYLPFDLNMPVILERRPDLCKSYEMDPPITELSGMIIKKLAREMRDRHAVPEMIYTSPRLACLQTAIAMQKMIRNNFGNCIIRVDPNLDTGYNWMQHYFNADDIERMGGLIDKSYIPSYMQKLESAQSSILLPAIVTNVINVLEATKQAPKCIKMLISDSLGVSIMHDALDGISPPNIVTSLSRLLSKMPQLSRGSGSDGREIADDNSAIMRQALLQRCDTIYPPLCMFVAYRENAEQPQNMSPYQMSHSQFRLFTSAHFSNAIGHDAEEVRP